MKNKIIILGLIAMFMVVSFIFIPPVQANNGGESSDQAKQQIEQNKQRLKDEIERQKQELQNAKKQKLQNIADKKNELKDNRADIRKKICEKSGQRARERYLSVQSRAQKINQRINSRVDRAKAFVTEHNLTIDNYDAMLADIEAKKSVAAAAAAAIEGSIGQFDCESATGKEQMAEIKSKVAIFKTAAKDYKTSVRTFLQAVKSAAHTQLQGQTDSQSTGGNQ